MGALCYKPEAKAPATAAIAEGEFDDLQRKALDVLSEKSDIDASLLYYNSNNSVGARPKAIFTLFRNVYRFNSISQFL